MCDLERQPLPVEDESGGCLGVAIGLAIGVTFWLALCCLSAGVL